MRKLKLLIASLTLVLGVSSVNAEEEDYTSYITNANLSSTEGWTLQATGGSWSSVQGSSPSFVIEAYAGWDPLALTAYSMKQDVTLPSGKYRAEGYAFYRYGLTADTDPSKSYAKFVAGDFSASVVTLGGETLDETLTAYPNNTAQASAAFTNGYYKSQVEFAIESESTIGFGYEGTHVLRQSWFIAGPIKLYRTGDFDYTLYQSQLESLVAEAKALQGQTMAASYSTALDNVITTYDGQSCSSVAAYNTAYAAINEAIANANASIADYANLLTAITNANNHTIYTPVFEASTTIYTNAVSTAQDVFNAAEVTDCTAAITALTNGIYGAYENDYSVFADDYAYDYSTLLNQDMTQWASTDYVTMTANEHWNGLTQQKYYEQSGAEWGASAWSHAASETATLPAGKYVMSITARASGDVTSTMSVKVGDAEAITVSLPNKGASGRGITTAGVGSYSDGTYANTVGRGWEYRFIAFEVAEESPVTISFSSSTNAQYQWVSLATPLLKGDVHPNQIKLNQAKSLATTLAGYESQISAATYATFADHITAANNATVESTDLDDIITNLQADIATAQAEAEDIAAARASFSALKAKAEILAAVDNDNSDANSTLSGAISAQATAAEANSVDDINNATSTLKDAMTTYVFAATPVGDGAQFDLTFMLTNPDVTSFWTGAWNVAPDGWYKDQEGGNFQVMNNGSVNAEDGIHDIFMEYYYLNNNTTYDNGLFNIYTKATLPVGTYTLSCYAFAKEENYSSGAPNPQVYFYANDTQGSLVSSSKLTEQSISFVNSEEQEVKIGLKPLTGNTYNWMGIGYVELYKVPAKTYTVDEAAAWDNTTAGAGEVTLKRTIKAGVNTLVLPFSMTKAEVESNFGAGSKVYGVKSYDAAAANISFGVKDGISANEPCLLKATVAGTSYTLANRTIVAGNPVKAGTNVTMTGTYAASMSVPTDSYSYIVSDGKLYKVDSNVTLKNTRAYITVTEPASARVLTMSFGDDATGIATIENGELKVETGVIYDLSGRKVTAPAKGIYVINGKKIVK